MTSTVPPDDDLVVALRRVAENLLRRSSALDVEGALSRIVGAAVRAVPASGGAVLRTEDGIVRSGHATDSAVGDLDERQCELGDGPGVTAATEPPPDGAVLAEDLGGDDADRWPRFAPLAVRAGYRSVLAVHLPTRTSGPRFALTLYGAGAARFDAHARRTAALFAVQAGVLLHGADEAQNLRRAIGTRDAIGQAKGMLMERFAVDETQAFTMLVSSSQETNMKLHDVVTWLIEDTRRRRQEAGPPSAPPPGRDGPLRGRPPDQA